MPDSYLSSLANVLPSTAIQSIASHFGTSDRTIFDGIQSSIAAVASGLAQKANDQGFIGQLIRLASSAPENAGFVRAHRMML